MTKSATVSGDPGFLFVHGGACTRHDWAGQVAGLGAQYRVLAIDLPGHGDNRTVDEISIEGFAAFIDDVRTRSLPDPIIFVGHSLGCRVVLEAHALRPQGVSGLIFVDGSLSSQGDPEVEVAHVASLIDRDPAAFLRRSFEAMFVSGSDLEIRQAVVDQAATIDHRLIRELLLRAIEWDARRAQDRLKKIDVPILLIQSTRIGSDFRRQSLSAGMSTGWTELVAGLVPQVDLRIIEGVGHFPHLEAPVQVNRLIDWFATTLR